MKGRIDVGQHEGCSFVITLTFANVLGWCDTVFIIPLSTNQKFRDRDYTNESPTIFRTEPIIRTVHIPYTEIYNAKMILNNEQSCISILC